MGVSKCEKMDQEIGRKQSVILISRYDAKQERIFPLFYIGAGKVVGPKHKIGLTIWYIRKFQERLGLILDDKKKI